MEESKNTDIEFIKALRTNLNKGHPAVHTLKRAFGTGCTDDLHNYISFLSLIREADLQDIKFNRDLYFLIACLFCANERPEGETDASKKSYVRTEQLFGRFYNDPDTSDTSRMLIQRFLETPYDKNGTFETEFTKLMKRALSKKCSNEVLDYINLIRDFKFWNNRENKVQRKWAETIICAN